jgi:serine/threonine-protein kinase RsbW/sigma-B regulation protein RsbU (phosphoserine phosphatase)
MMGHGMRAAIALKNDLSELARLAEALQAFSSSNGLSDGTLFAVNLALEELVTNTISYGFSDEQPHVIDITLHLDGPDLHVRVEDDAAAFNPLERASPDLDAPIEDRAIGGLGVHLVRTLMDDVRYAREGTRNVVSMRKRVNQERE